MTKHFPSMEDKTTENEKCLIFIRSNIEMQFWYQKFIS